jgi:hypothetical protein
MDETTALTVMASSNSAAVSYTVGALSAKHLGRMRAEPRGWPGQARTSPAMTENDMEISD